MATFDLSGLSRSGGGTGSGILADQLQILENSLAKDGNLSPGDYNLLIDTARKLATSPGLSAAQRSNYNVKVSQYEKDKSVAGLHNTSDIKRMNDSLQNEGAEDVINVGNNPSAFLAGRAASYVAKLNDLAEVIQLKDNSGADTEEYVNEYNQTIRDYQDVVAAQQAMQGWQQRGDSSQPIPGFAAYVTTNDRGEITDVKYGRYGGNSGYVETNGSINGFQVFGKVNAKQNGSNVFVLGDQRFSAPDVMQPDPTNPGSFKVQRLVAESMQTGDAFKQGKPGFLNFDPNKLLTQSYIPRNSWFKSSDGTLYQRRDDGGYSKYLNFTPPDIDPKSVFTVPKSVEQSILGRVDKTIDGSSDSLNPAANFVGPLNPNNMGPSIPVQSGGNTELGPTASPMGETFNPFQAGPDASQLQVTPASQPVSPPVSVNQRTQSPTQRSPQGFSQLASQTINKAGKFFKDLFS